MRDFTSLPPEEEKQFVVYERRAVQTGKAASVLSYIIAGTLFVLTVFVVIALKPANMHNVVEAADQEAAAAETAKEEKKAKAAAAVVEKPAEAEPEAAPAGEETEE